MNISLNISVGQNVSKILGVLSLKGLVFARKFKWACACMTELSWRNSIKRTYERTKTTDQFFPKKILNRKIANLNQSKIPFADLTLLREFVFLFARYENNRNTSPLSITR